MSYDFAALTPESAGTSDREALATAVAVFEQEELDAEPDPRLQGFVSELAAASAADEVNGWVSVWPLDVGVEGVAIPTTYADVDRNLTTLLKLAAGAGLVLVDPNAETVYPPAPGQPIGVVGGDGTRLGALTRERLESLLAGLPPEDPWLVLERGPNLYIQTYRQGDGAFLFERRDGSPDRHFRTTLPDRDSVASRIWAWLTGEPDWDVDLDWQHIEI